MNFFGRPCEIYVGNLLSSITKDELLSTFKDFEVKNVELHLSSEKTYAFLLLDSVASVRRAVQEMDRFRLKGTSMTVRAGNSQLHATILKEKCLGQKAVRGSTPPPVSPPSVQHNVVDNGPPPLEAVYEPCTNSDDSPPPLEEVFQNNICDNDLPPPLEPVLIKGSILKNVYNHCLPVTLVVANFPCGTTEEDLVQLFREYLPLKASVIVNQKLQDPNEKTYAYVTLPDMELAERAIAEMDSRPFKKENLIVTYMLERVKIY